MKKNRQQEEQRRHRGYEAAKISYTKRRYAHAAMQLYSQMRTDEIRRVIIKLFGSNSFISLLDVGCGTGVLLSELAEKRPNMKLNGVDFSQKMLHEAQPRLARLGITAHLVNASAFELPYVTDSFDVVVSTRFIHQYSDDLKIQILREMRRCLKPEGFAVVEFYSFVPWLMRYFFCWWKVGAKEHFKHCTSQGALMRMIGPGYATAPLMIPGCTRLSKVVGVSRIPKIRKLLKNFRLNLLFDQYLAVFGKK